MASEQTKSSKSDEEEDEETYFDFQDVIDEWCGQNRATSLEGDRGLENLNKLAEAIGYEKSPWNFGSPLEVFLSDNPGACEAIFNWIVEHGEKTTEWRDLLEGQLKEKDGK